MATEAEIQAALEAAEQNMAERVYFGAKQQEKVNALIREAQGRASRDLRAELEIARNELQAYRSEASPELVTARTALAAEKTAREAAEARERRSLRDASLKDACHEVGLLAPSDAARLLSDSVKFIDGQWVPVDPNGNIRTKTGGEPMSVLDLAREHAEARPWSVRGSVKGGSGSHEASRFAEPEPELRDLFGAKSNAEAANRLALTKPREYARLRRLAQAGGLIP